VLARVETLALMREPNHPREAAEAMEAARHELLRQRTAVLATLASLRTRTHAAAIADEIANLFTSVELPSLRELSTL
jgi:hypothetical protein